MSEESGTPRPHKVQVRTTDECATAFERLTGERGEHNVSVLYREAFQEYLERHDVQVRV